MYENILSFKCKQTPYYVFYFDVFCQIFDAYALIILRARHIFRIINYTYICFKYYFYRPNLYLEVFA